MKKLRANNSQKLNNVLFFLAGVVAVVVVGLIIFGVVSKVHSAQNKQQYIRPDEETHQEPETQTVEKWQEGVISYQGKYYKYNTNIRSFLLMGIDSDDPVSASVDGVSGGQSDAMFLLVVDDLNETLSIISINRNTMTRVEVYDENGGSLGTMTAQICTQHGFGDGRRLSCSRTVDAVSYLFYNIPIAGYISINMGAIPTLNDAVGGVEVEVLDTLNYPAQGVKLEEGDTVLLSGKEAYCYLRGRDIYDFNSATDRLKRGEQYLVNYFNKLKEETNGRVSQVVEIYNSVAEYVVSSVSMASLIGQLMDYDFSEDMVYTVPGDTRMGDEYEEFYVNDDEFYDLIIRTFYEEVPQ